MNPTGVADYGWQAEAPHSCAYLAPQVLRILRELGAARVLDLGSGNGHLSGELARAGLDVVGVEQDGHGLEIARAALPGVPFHRQSVDDDPRRLLERERPFDVVVSTEVIEHLYTPAHLARYAHAVLVDGGHLVVSTPYHGYWKNLALALLGRWDHHHTALWEGGHIKFFSFATLAALLTANGFEVVRFVGVGRAPGFWKSMIVVARRCR